MGKLSGIKPTEVFRYFEEICSIPHGSGDMVKIADYCESFAREHGLEYYRDDANNVVIKKCASCGYESHEAVILQGHLDMVCQKDKDAETDFEKDGIDVYCDGDFIKAKGTTLGADNGIAVAMMLAILSDESIAHPPIEAVFTTDEEIGMIGAGKLDVGILKGKKLINLDAEEEEYLTVSCAGGSDIKAKLPTTCESVIKDKINIEITGLIGGHSGVEIDKGRVNANLLAGRLLLSLSKSTDFDIISVNGGTKANAIPVACSVELAVSDTDGFSDALSRAVEIIKAEFSEREPSLEITMENGGEEECFVLSKEDEKKLIILLASTPNGVIDMSKSVQGLVETSLNLGILKTEDNCITAVYALRSNKSSGLDYLEDKMHAYLDFIGFENASSGRYEPWEYRENSELQRLYSEVYEDIAGKKPVVTAIHAGLECAVFSSAIANSDCIAIGPDMFGVHTTSEKLSISSTGRIFEILCKLLEKL